MYRHIRHILRHSRHISKTASVNSKEMLQSWGAVPHDAAREWRLWSSWTTIWTDVAEVRCGESKKFRLKTPRKIEMTPTNQGDIHGSIWIGSFFLSLHFKPSPWLRSPSLRHWAREPMARRGTERSCFFWFIVHRSPWCITYKSIEYLYTVHILLWSMV